jgi:WD40 repeat protein
MQTVTFIFASATENVSQLTISYLYSLTKLKYSTKQGTKWKGKIAMVRDNDIVIFDTITQTELKVLEHKREPEYVIQLRNGNIVTSNDDKNIYMWNIETGKIIKTFSGHIDIPYLLLELQNGNIFTESSEGILKIFDVVTGTCVLTIDNKHQLGSVCQLQDGTVISSDMYLMTIWDMNTGESKYSMSNTEFYYTMIEVEKNIIVCGSDTAIIDIYHITTEITRLMKIHSSFDFTYSAVLMKNGNFATACFGGIEVWNRNGECVVTKKRSAKIFNEEYMKIAEVEPGVLAFQNGTKLAFWNIETNSTNEIDIGSSCELRYFLFD